VILFAVFVVLWGNAVALVFGSTAWLPGGSWSFVFAGIALVAISLLTSRRLGLDAAALGLAGDPVRGALVGLAIGAAAAAVAVAALRTVATAIVAHPIEYAPLTTAVGPDLARHVAFFLPLGSILPEEIAFRGVVLGAFIRTFNRRGAIVAASVAFTLGDTTLGPASPWFGVGITGAVLAVFIGGVLFAQLRLRTGTLATSILAHWSFNSGLLLGLWSTRVAPAGCC